MGRPAIGYGNERGVPLPAPGQPFVVGNTEGLTPLDEAGPTWCEMRTYSTGSNRGPGIDSDARA